MKLSWPPRPLGLGTPLCLAALSPRTRPGLFRDLRLVPVFGLVTALVIVAVDVLLSDGATIGRMPSLDDHPTVISRVFVSLFGSVLEEVMFRLVLATFIAWLAYLGLSRFMANPKGHAQWCGTFAAAVTTALWWHLSSMDDPFTVARVLTVNLVSGVAYGWLYWSKGLEVSVMTHTVVYLCLYIGVPAFR